MPTDWPSKIVPQASNDTDSANDDTENEEIPAGAAQGFISPQTDASAEVNQPANSTLISILLTSAMSWSWLLAQSDASAQVFAYMPVLISEALDIEKKEVKTDSLEAWQPPGWTGNARDM